MASSRSSSDQDSTSSSFTALDSLSFSSSISVKSNGDLTPSTQKPHKASQAEWEAIRRLRSSAGRVGLDHFRLVRRLGSGDLGNVYLCRLAGDQSKGATCMYAMKVVDKEALAIRKKVQRAETEREILRCLDHPFLPSLYAEFEASHYSCLVMEFCSGGDLHVARQRQPGRRFSVASVKFYAAEIILALEYLHMMGIIYRDLKPENVLIRDDGHIMLSDFDLSLKCHVVPKILRHKLTAKHPKPSCMPPMQPVLSCFSKKDPNPKPNPAQEQAEPELVAEPISARSKSFVGTHEYLAPEVISGAGHGSAVDWWTLGVFLYEMLHGKTPFKGENNERTLVNIIKQAVTLPAVTGGGKEGEEVARANDLIGKLLVKNAKRRIGSVRGAGEIKQHEFFKGVNWALIRSVRPPEVPRDTRRGKGGGGVRKLSRRERDEPFKNGGYFDYF